MKSVLKLIRRFVGIMLLAAVLLVGLNFILLAVYTLSWMPNAHPWKTAEEVAGYLVQDDGSYFLPEEIARELEEADVWGILIDNTAMQVVWQSDNLPETVPEAYSAADIARLTRGYIDGYPTFTAGAENGLVVLGYPKDSFWKHIWPSWDYDLIADLPKTMFSVLAVNIALIFVIYMLANSGVLKAVKPIVRGIQALPAKEAIHIREKGLLSELAVNINKTSEILQSQSRQLRKKETARANWIAGVSHDIRTPLSMVMGYAGQLESDMRLSEEDRKKAAVIVQQSKRMRNLINDLNLASKLEYNMQPVNPARQNLIAVVRQAAVDFINMDIDEKYPVEWETDENLTACFSEVDGELIKRAVSNLISNCINHNKQGCRIHVSVRVENSNCITAVEDDGVGADEELIKRLDNAPHYMVCDENISEQRHGLGLLIVKQIMAVHGGTVHIGHSAYGGFSVQLILPLAGAGNGK